MRFHIRGQRPSDRLPEHDGLLIDLSDGRMKLLVQRGQILPPRESGQQISRVLVDVSRPRLIDQLVAYRKRIIGQRYVMQEVHFEVPKTPSTCLNSVAIILQKFAK